MTHTPETSASTASLPVLSLDTAPPAPPHFSREDQAFFLDRLAQCGNVLAAARATGVSRSTAYRMRRACARFARLWDAALLLARPQVEAVLADRALNGVEETIFYHGEAVATRRRYDARLLLAHLGRLDRLAKDCAASDAAAEFDLELNELAKEEEITFIACAPAQTHEADADDHDEGHAGAGDEGRDESPEERPDAGEGFSPQDTVSGVSGEGETHAIGRPCERSQDPLQPPDRTGVGGRGRAMKPVGPHHLAGDAPRAGDGVEVRINAPARHGARCALARGGQAVRGGPTGP